MSGGLDLALLRGARALAGVLPEPLVRHAGLGLGRLAYGLAGARRRMAQRHMRRVLGPGADAERAAREVFAHYGRYWAELAWMRPRRRSRVLAHVTLEGHEHLDACRARGRGVIIALPHLGNWEMAGLVAAARGIELVAVAERLADRRGVEWFRERRRELGIEVVLADAEPSAVGRLLAQLRRGGAVALLCDRDLSGGGVNVPFFGEETTLPAGPAVLALRTGAAIVPVAPCFRPGRGHRIVIGAPIAIPVDGPPRERIALATRRLAEALEALIRQAPTQWLLLQPNWPSDKAANPPRQNHPRRATPERPAITSS
jgi:KDO2-lipid IV(A) lauroyltransferase